MISRMSSEVEGVLVVAVLVMVVLIGWDIRDHAFAYMPMPQPGTLNLDQMGLEDDTALTVVCGKAHVSHIEWTTVNDPVADEPFNPAGFMANRAYDLGSVYCGGHTKVLHLDTGKPQNARAIMRIGSQDAWLKTVCPKTGGPYEQDAEFDGLDDGDNDVMQVTCYSGFHFVKFVTHGA